MILTGLDEDKRSRKVWTRDEEHEGGADSKATRAEFWVITGIIKGSLGRVLTF